jgi:DNA-directed RNA polymerase subunit omega
LAKERTSQLNAGEKALVPIDNDKNTVVSLREIAEGKVSLKVIEDVAINKLRNNKSEPKEVEDLEIDQEDNFDKIYKGEISKSGAAILPSKRIRRMPEKVTSVEKKLSKEVMKQTDLEAENESVSADNKSVSADNKSVSEDNKSVSEDNKSVSVDNKSVSEYY